VVCVINVRVLDAAQKTEMIEDISTTLHLFVAMTMTKLAETQTTARNSMASSSVTSDEFYWAWAVLFWGVVRTARNDLILYALVASKQHKKHALIVNQNALDLFSSFFDRVLRRKA